MHETLEKLLKGDDDIVGFYLTAKEKWPELFQSMQQDPVQDWARWLTVQQVAFFEHQCGGRRLGKEVMVWSSFAVLYNTNVGFGGNRALATKLVEAFAKSGCSIGVKSEFRKALTSYDLDCDPRVKPHLRNL
jgi:hypothetical protein